MPPFRLRTSPPRILVTAIGFLLTTSCNEATAPEQSTAFCDFTGPSRVVAFPSGWGGGAPVGYQLGTERSCVHGGVNAGFLASTSVNPAGFTALTQTIRPDDFRGKRVRWKGWVRHQDIANFGGLWMRVDGPGTMMAFDNSFQHPLKGSSEWREISVVLDVPTEALGIAFGVLLVGAGDLIVDDLVMEVVPMSVASTDQLLVPEPIDADSATVAAQYATRPLRGANFSFEGSGTATALTAPSNEGPIVSLPGRPIR